MKQRVYGSFSSLWTSLHTKKAKISFNCKRQTGCSGNLTKIKLKLSCDDLVITFKCGCWFINQWSVRWTIYKPASLRFSVFPSTMTSAPINFALWSRSAMISVAILTGEEYSAMHVKYSYSLKIFRRFWLAQIQFSSICNNSRQIIVYCRTARTLHWMR